MRKIGFEEVTVQVRQIGRRLKLRRIELEEEKD